MSIFEANRNVNPKQLIIKSSISSGTTNMTTITKQPSATSLMPATANKIFNDAHKSMSVKPAVDILTSHSISNAKSDTNLTFKTIISTNANKNATLMVNPTPVSLISNIRNIIQNNNSNDGIAK